MVCSSIRLSIDSILSTQACKQKKCKKRMDKSCPTILHASIQAYIKQLIASKKESADLKIHPTAIDRQSS